jgi:hypothetical protein
VAVAAGDQRQRRNRIVVGQPRDAIDQRHVITGGVAQDVVLQSHAG